MQSIKFGTDGWRDKIADGYTFENVRRVTQATCYTIKRISKSRYLAVGYDRRFNSVQFALAVAKVAMANGFKVEISDCAIGSPVLSWWVRQKKSYGVMITASHNPYDFNGFKVKGPHGGSVDEAVTRKIEDSLDISTPMISDEEPLKKNFSAPYVAFLKKCVSPSIIQKLKLLVVFDAMSGPGGDLLASYLTSSSIKMIRVSDDPLFQSGAPEPIERYLDPLKEELRVKKYSFGFAVDGDADRIGVIDEMGRYLPPQTVMPLILFHLLKNKKLPGRVVQTVSMGYLPKRICEEYKRAFMEVSVGFKNIAAEMLKGKVLMGGEESGGYGFGTWTPERDGILCGLLLAEFIAKEKKSLSVLVEELYSKFGHSEFKRVDFPISSPVDKPVWTQSILVHVDKEIGQQPVKHVNSSDGIKVVAADDSWVLLRPSGTEPLIRTYAEAEKMEVVKQYLDIASNWIQLVEKEEAAKLIALKKEKRKTKKAKN